VASAIAYRRHFSTSRYRLIVLLVISIAGGVLGAVLLVRTSDSSFLRVLPWLMLAATVTFTFGERWPRRPVSSGREVTDRSSPDRVPLVALLIQLGIATYGGYFGGGAGILMLAMLSMAGLSDIHEMNGLKSLLSVAISAVAVTAFLLYGIVVWRPEIVMMAGAIVGGYGGASIARRLAHAGVRRFVVLIGWVMTAYFFVR
jgi:uncharacterized membrane protein YfcA